MNAVQTASHVLPAAEHDIEQGLAHAPLGAGDSVSDGAESFHTAGSHLSDDHISLSSHGSQQSLHEIASQHDAASQPGSDQVDLEAGNGPRPQMGWGEHLAKNVFGAFAGQATHQLYPPNLAATAVKLFTTPKAIGQGAGAGLGLSAASLLANGAPHTGAAGGNLAATAGLGFIGVGANGANDVIKHETIPHWMPDAIRPDMANPTAEGVATGTKWFLNAGTAAILGAGISRASE